MRVVRGEDVVEVAPQQGGRGARANRRRQRLERPLLVVPHLGHHEKGPGHSKLLLVTIFVIVCYLYLGAQALREWEVFNRRVAIA